jgi:hypothetical protein
MLLLMDVTSSWFAVPALIALSVKVAVVVAATTSAPRGSWDATHVSNFDDNRHMFAS